MCVCAATYGDRAKTAIAFAFNADFARVLQAQMDRFNSEGDPKIAKIRQQLGEVKGVMLENIDRVLLRGEKIELLVDKTEILEEHAFKFNRFDAQPTRRRCGMAVLQCSSSNPGSFLTLRAFRSVCVRVPSLAAALAL